MKPAHLIEIVNEDRHSHSGNLEDLTLIQFDHIPYVEGSRPFEQPTATPLLSKTQSYQQPGGVVRL